MKRLVKTAKLHVVDTGLACALLRLDADDLVADRKIFGQLGETFVLQELRRQASGNDADLRFHHLRDKDQDEVDIVIERGARRLVGVEVKVGQTVRTSDFKGLRKLQRATGERFACGVVVYDGEACLPFGERLWALPIRRLWDGLA